jgi:hypothetical protein
MRDLEDC